MAVAIAQQDRGDPELVEARPGLLGTVMSEVWRGSGASRGSPSAFGDGGKVTYSVVSNRTGSLARLISDGLGAMKPGP